MKQFLTIAARHQALSIHSQSQEWASQELTLLVPDYWHWEPQLLPNSWSLNLFAVANHRIIEVRCEKGSHRHSTCFPVHDVTGCVLVLYSVKSCTFSWSSFFQYRCCIIIFTWCFISGLFPPPLTLISSSCCYRDCLLVNKLEGPRG